MENLEPKYIAEYNSTCS